MLRSKPGMGLIVASHIAREFVNPCVQVSKKQNFGSGLGCSCERPPCRNIDVASC